MNDAKLILDIGADVSQFTKTLDQVTARIKEVKNELKSASGLEIGELNFKLTGLERTQDTLLRFGSFAEGTIGAIIAQLATLKQEKLEIKEGDTSTLEKYNLKIQELTLKLKELNSVGIQKVESVVDPVVINSIEYFNQQINELQKQNKKIAIDTSEGRQQMSILNSSIEYYQDRIKEASSLGKTINPVSTAAINSIQYFNQQIEKLTARRNEITIDTVDARAEIASLNNQIASFEEKIAETQNIGKSVQFIDLNTLTGLQARLNEIDKIKATIDITDEGEIARLNSEAIQLKEQIDRVNSLGFDDKGQIATGAAKARQSITNFGLVLQDLPFGFIAIQNNIPNLISSFQGLQTEAKKTGVSVGSILTQQFAGASGAILGVGLAVSALTGVITVLVQQYGSLGAAIDAIIAKSISLEDINKRIEKSFLNVTKSTSGEAANLKSLIAIYTDSTTSQTALLGVKEKINKEYPTLIAFLEDENRLTDESRRIIEERSKALFKQSILEGRRQGLIKLISEETAKGEEAVNKVNKVLNNEIDIVEGLELAFRSLFVPFKAGPIGVFEILNNDISNAQKSLTRYNQKLAENNALLAQVDGEITEIIKRIQDEDKKRTESDNKRKRAAEERLRELERYREALLKFNTLKIDVFELPDDSKVINDKIKNLTKYGDVLLDTTKYDFERADALRNIIDIDKEYFASLNLQKMTLLEIKTALESYITSLVKLQNTPIVETAGKFETLFRTLKKFKDETRIPILFDEKFKSTEFDKITDGVKNFTERTGITFEKWRQDIINKLILDQGVQGFVLSLEQIDAALANGVKSLNDEAAKIRVKDALAKIFGTGSTIDDDIANIINTIKKVEEVIASSLERPFRDFFDNLIENGKVSLKSFADLFKDILKRIASQLIASGIAKLVSSILFPPGAVAGAVTGAAGGAASGAAGGGILKFLGKLLGIGKSAGEANFSGIGTGGMQLAGQVVFTQRGSDLVGVLNRTNGTINRVG